MVKEIVQIKIDSIQLEGLLGLSDSSRGLVIFVHGSGSSRHSPRNNFIAEELNAKGLSTLLFDLLTQDEDTVYENRFDIDLLTDRLLKVTKWVQTQDRLKGLSLGYFGASTGAAAAIQAAAKLKKDIKAIVSRGGRTDLAMDSASAIESPTMLIVGEMDDVVVELNEEIYEKLECEKEMVIIPGATHLFEEPGTLEKVADYTQDWFGRFLI